MPKIDKHGNITEDPIYETRIFDEWPHEGFFKKTPCKFAGDWKLIEVIEDRGPSTTEKRGTWSKDSEGNEMSAEYGTYTEYYIELPGDIIGYRYKAQRKIG